MAETYGHCLLPLAKQALEHLGAAFTSGGVRAVTREDESLKDKLYSQIGQLKVENDWLKKKSELLP